MKPAVCPVCARGAAGLPGAWIAFADHVPTPSDELGASAGIEWFCSAHAPAAEAMTDRSAADAIAALTNMFAAVPAPSESPPGAWLRRFRRFRPR